MTYIYDHLYSHFLQEIELCFVFVLDKFVSKIIYISSSEQDIQYVIIVSIMIENKIFCISESLPINCLGVSFLEFFYKLFNRHISSILFAVSREINIRNQERICIIKTCFEIFEKFDSSAVLMWLKYCENMFI